MPVASAPLPVFKSESGRRVFSQLSGEPSLAYDLHRCGCDLPVFSDVQYPTGLLTPEEGETFAVAGEFDKLRLPSILDRS